MTDRGCRGAAYTLLTPANHYPCRLPNLPGARVVKLVTPRLAPARFAEYLVELAPGGATSEPIERGFETFLYGLEGEILVEARDRNAGRSGRGRSSTSRTTSASRCAGIRTKPAVCSGSSVPTSRFRALDAPDLTAGHRDDEPFEQTAVPGFRRRELLDPTDPRLDFNMSLLAFDPGTGLDKIEIHDEEHGLYMTAGTGEYLLDRDRHDVQEGDFIYMAPYCPQGFTATGDGPRRVPALQGRLPRRILTAHAIASARRASTPASTSTPASSSSGAVYSSG